MKRPVGSPAVSIKKLLKRIKPVFSINLITRDVEVIIVRIPSKLKKVIVITLFYFELDTMFMF